MTDLVVDLMPPEARRSRALRRRMRRARIVRIVGVLAGVVMIGVMATS